MNEIHYNKGKFMKTTRSILKLSFLNVDTNFAHMTEHHNKGVL